MRFKSFCMFSLLLCVPLYSQDWAALQNSLIKFYRYQRAGLKPTTDNPTGNPYNPFYTQPGSDGKFPHWSDGGSTPVDGGFYDAGDFMKFGLPLGFSVYCLLKAYDAFPDSACYDDNNSWNALGTKDNIPDILNEAKVGTDYLIKAVISSSQVVKTIGNGPSDHGGMGESGYANSSRTSPRPVSYCDGADIPGFYAAALACMSVLYKKYDAAYSTMCAQKAKDAYTFAMAHLKVCTEQTDPSTGNPFYTTTTYKDKLACAAIELYRATKDSTYLTAARTHISGVPQHYDALGYAHCGDLAAFELYRQGDRNSQGAWRADIGVEIGRVVKAGTPFVGGATVNSTDWGVCRGVGNSAFSAALLYAISGNVALKAYVAQQIKWLAGISPFTRSWITQYGTNFPQNPHSRNDMNLRPARLTGGVVSGPTTSGTCTSIDKSTCTWGFSDNNGIYKNTECALDYGCGAIGAVAFLRWIGKTTDTLRIDTPLTATLTNLNLVTQTQTIVGSLDKSTSWKVIIEGQSSKAKKTYTGTGTQISITGWNGLTDAGSASFTAEKVVAYLDTTSLKIWDMQRGSVSQTSFNITNVPLKAWGANDIEVDNFNDSTILDNQLSGKWSTFSDVSENVAGAKSGAPFLAADVGPDKSKALYFSLTRLAGATVAGGPFSGVKTTFSTQWPTVNLGTADTIMFDIEPLANNANLTVELEQSDITDKAYFGRTLVFGAANAWARTYVPIASLTQPAWKTAAKTLNLNKIVSLRFVAYGVGNDRFVLDNVRISNLAVSQSAAVFGSQKLSTSPIVKNVEFYQVSPTSLSYGMFFKGVEGKAIAAELFDCLGKSITSYQLKDYKTGSIVTIKGLTLHTGIYFLKHTIIDANKSVIVSFMVTK